MEKIIRKTQKEIEDEDTLTPVQVLTTFYYYWTCDKCLIAFSGTDTILKSSRRGYKCPLPRGFLGNFCKNSIYGIDEITLPRYYKIKS